MKPKQAANRSDRERHDVPPETISFWRSAELGYLYWHPGATTDDPHIQEIRYQEFGWCISLNRR